MAMFSTKSFVESIRDHLGTADALEVMLLKVGFPE